MPAAGVCSELFTFTVSHQEYNQFHVINFKGSEGLNKSFYFEINLCSPDTAVDINSLVGVHAVFSIRREKKAPAVFHGAIMKMEQKGYYNGYSFYTVEFRSLFWRATQFIYNFIYLDQNIKQTLSALMAGDGFHYLPVEFRLSDKYPTVEFSLQYNESFYDYILWRIEKEGIYFYFSPKDDTIIFADSPNAHEASSGTVHYSSEDNLDYLQQEETVRCFTLSQTILPNRVVVKSYDWKNPNDPLVAQHIVSDQGLGDVYYSNEEFATVEEARRIAKIRAEQIYSQHRIFYGESGVPFFRAGVVFTLDGHYNKAFNRDYMITEVKHEGSQDAYLNLELQVPMRGSEHKQYYKNSFNCIESDVFYRPPITAKRASIPGFIHAFIDGDGGSDNTPIMDKYGRYRIEFQFDIMNRTPGKASCWVRRAQEQVGRDCGMAFPLTPGTEVLISFKNGNPDFPIITGAVANGESGSISGGGNSKISGIRTEGGPQLTFDNKTNGMNLSISGGSGITLSTNGDSDMLQSSSDIRLNVASSSTAQLSGILQNNLSGYRLQNVTAYNPKWMAFIALLEVASKIPAHLQKALAENTADPNKAKENAKESSGGGFDASSLNFLFSFLPVIFMPHDGYQAVMTASRSDAASMVQSLPTRKELLCHILFIVLARIGNVATDVIKYKNDVKQLEKAENVGDIDLYKETLSKCLKEVYDCRRIENYKDFWYETEGGKRIKGRVYLLSETSPCACYAETSKALNLTIYAYKSAIDDNPKETDVIFKKINSLSVLTSTLSMSYQDFCVGEMTKYEYKKSTKQNLRRNLRNKELLDILPELAAILALVFWNLYGEKRKIGGVFINSEDKNVNIHAKTYISQHAERGIYFNTKKAAIKDVEEWGAPLPNTPQMKIETAEGDPLIRQIFEDIQYKFVSVRQDTGRNKRQLVKDIVKKGHINRREEDAAGGGMIEDAQPNTTFIAGRTDLYYTHSSAHFNYCTDQYVSFAPRQSLENLFGDCFIRFDERGQMFFKAINKIEMKCCEDQHNGFSLLFDKKGAFFGLRPQEGDTFLRGINQTKEVINVFAGKPHSYTALSMSDSLLFMGFYKKNQPNSVIAVDTDSIFLNSKKTVASGVEISDNKITKAKGGTFIIGDNAVKVIQLKDIDKKDHKEDKKKMNQDMKTRLEVFKEIEKEDKKEDRKEDKKEDNKEDDKK